MLRQAAQEKRSHVPTILTDLDSPASSRSTGSHSSGRLQDGTLVSIDSPPQSECKERPELPDIKASDVPSVGIVGWGIDDVLDGKSDKVPVSAWTFEDRRSRSLETNLGETETTCNDSGTTTETANSKSLNRSLTSQTSASRSLGRKFTRCKSNLGRVEVSPLSQKKIALMKDEESCLQRLTRSQAYEIVSAVLILANAAFILWETQQRSTEVAKGGDGADSILTNAVSDIFCICFLVDLVFRFGADKEAFFLRPRERLWNLMDAFVVVTAMGEVAFQWYAFGSGSSTANGVRHFLRKFSMLRIARLLRVVRRTKAMWVIKLIKELRIMVLCLVGALKSLCWSMVLLFIVLTVFGVFFTDGAVAYIQHEPMGSNSSTELRKYFGTLSKSVLSLYKSMAGGEDWAVVLDALAPLPYEYSLFFLFFIAFSTLALMNVVTAVFVGAALQRTQQDRELVVQEQMEFRAEFQHTMEQIFYELDANGSGELNFDEFESYMEDANIKAFLSTCQLDIAQVRLMFKLLDTDGTGSVDLDEFITGCFRLRGGATSLDVAFLSHKVEEVQKDIAVVQDSMGVPKVLAERPGSRMLRSAASRNRPRQ